MKKSTVLHRTLFCFLLFGLLTGLSLFAGRPAQWLVYKKGDFLFDFKVDHKGEVFYVKNGDFLSGNQMDQYVYAQTTWDFTSHVRFGDSINSKMALRERARWGQTHAIMTTGETLKVVDFSLEEQQHGFNYLVPWFKKIWVKFSLNDAFNIPTDGRHYIKCGIFPFELGRGIALGSAYATAPGMLGFFTDNTIDQFAPGLLLHGDVSTAYKIEYDAYLAVVHNQFSAVGRNTDTIYTNCYGCPSAYRGTGSISYILAGRLFWTIFDTTAFGSLTAEPYVLFYSQPENKLEYKADAAVKLGTYGFAVDYSGSRFELGFEAAANAGHQCVKTWDRNYIIANRNGTTASVQEVYSNVYAVPTGTAYTTTGSYSQAQVTDTNKAVVSSSPAGTSFNGQAIGAGNIVSVTGSTACTLYNGYHRFRPSYKNIFGGCMVVLDGAYWFKPSELKCTATLAYASGDENPNQILDYAENIEYTDTYSGFIGLQEIYSGKRVRSLFVLGQRVPRPLTAPYAGLDSALQQYATNVAGFTNLVYTGIGLTWTPTGYKRKIKVNPNVLYYWQDAPSKKYCLAYDGGTGSGQGGTSLNENARRALGLEINTLAEISFLDNLKGYAALAVFVPGSHYQDIIGKPVNSSQYKEVTRSSRHGIDYNSYPLLNKKTAFALNMGFEYLF